LYYYEYYKKKKIGVKSESRYILKTINSKFKAEYFARNKSYSKVSLFAHDIEKSNVNSKGVLKERTK